MEFSSLQDLLFPLLNILSPEPIFRDPLSSGMFTLYNTAMTMFDIKAISLRTTPFREHDRIVSFYSAEHGELRAVAKSVKKPTSKLAGACEPLTLNHVYLARGRSLHTLCHYERLESFPEIRQDLTRLAIASICTEVIRFCGQENDQDSPLIYEQLALTLRSLNQPEMPWVMSSIRFHIGMLALNGYLPSFRDCVQCNHPLNLDELSYFPFSPMQGGFLCQSCHGLRSHVHAVNVSTQTIRLFLTPDDPEFSENTLKAHKFLAYYWESRLERPLKSFDFLFQMTDQAFLCAP
jgi:DNA repair protein RecO (recombination protein O)